MTQRVCLFVCLFCRLLHNKVQEILHADSWRKTKPTCSPNSSAMLTALFLLLFFSISRAPSLKQRKKRQGLSTVMFILTAGYISCQIPLSPSCHTRLSLLLFHSAVTSQLFYTLFSHVRLSASLVHLQRWSELHLEITIVKGWARIWLPKQSSTAMWDAIG